MTTAQPKYARRPFPADTLAEAVALAQAIQDKNNGRPMNRVLLADAIGRKPASSQYKELLSSSFKYGLTIGNEKSGVISLTELGVALTKPRDPSEHAASLRTAALQPDLFRRLADHYSNGKLPRGSFFLSVLERDFGVPRERCQECAETLVQNGKFAGIIQELQETLYVILDAESMPAEAPGGEDPVQEAEVVGAPVTGESQSPESHQSPAGERFIFLGHGKSRRPLEQLEKVLQQFKIPYKVAVDEPQMARPISVKVASVMRECHSAILIFTSDEEFKTPDDRQNNSQDTSL